MPVHAYAKNMMMQTLLNREPLNRAPRLISILVVLSAFLSVTPAWSETGAYFAQLRLDHAALRAAEDDYRMLRKDGLDGIEAADYASYVARLQRRVFEDCRMVIESGSDIPDDLPCPLELPPASGSADIQIQNEMTQQEQLAALDAMLNSSLGEFDEKLLREQERIKADTPNDNSIGGQGDGNGAGDGGEQGTGDGGPGLKGAENTSISGAGVEADSQAQQGGSNRVGGAEKNTSGNRDEDKDNDQPKNIPDGSDDDVVARQLREAAEQEDDPELKAKLWEEYRRYKLGTKE